MSKDGAGSAAGRPLRGGADRNLGERPNIFTVVGRPLRGGADRNALLAPTEYRNSRRPWGGGADRNRLSSSTPTRSGLRGGSPPARGRGSKHFTHHWVPRSAHGVAPCAGARIETPSPCTAVTLLSSLSSPPARGRGSKPLFPCTAVISLYFIPIVAPCVGARIETAGRAGHRPTTTGSPPARGRGSKQNSLSRRSVPSVAPCAGARIETGRPGRDAGRTTSPPARGRGSKHRVRRPLADDLSLTTPARGRGSKLQGRCRNGR